MYSCCMRGREAGRAWPGSRRAPRLRRGRSLRYTHDMRLSPVAVAASRMMRVSVERTLSRCVERLRFTRTHCISTRRPHLPSDAANRNDIPPRASVVHTLSTGVPSDDCSAFANARAGQSRSVSLIDRSRRRSLTLRRAL